MHVRTFNNAVNLGGQSCGEGGGIGCDQRSVVQAVMWSTVTSSWWCFQNSLLSFPVSSCALISGLFFLSRLFGCANVQNSRVGVYLAFSTASITLPVELGEGLKRREWFRQEQNSVTTGFGGFFPLLYITKFCRENSPCLWSTQNSTYCCGTSEQEADGK